ncbi:MAG: hypothetical protein R3A48_18685 [Polyangiales bacterium]
MSRFYGSFEEFAREEIRPLHRVGWCAADLDIDSDLGTEELNFESEDEDFEDDE